jgi:aldose 1-epimerase
MQTALRASLLGLTIAALTGALASTSALAATATRAPFGRLADGTAVEAVTLTNAKGMSVRIMTQGATIQQLIVPDRNGVKDDVALGYDTAAEYLAKPEYFGASIGRYANRIAKGKFTLDGKAYTLATNDGPNHLHGGLKGFDKRLWKIDQVTSGAEAQVVMRYVSPDMEEGYPGELHASVTYALNENNELHITYSATTNKPTIVNLTNHNFFNLAGNKAGKDVQDEKLTLDATRFTPVDKTLIPTNKIASVAGTPLDFRKATPIGTHLRDGKFEQIQIGRGIDHNFIIDGAAGTMRHAARVEDPSSGRVLDLSLTAPALQVYSGNFLDATVTGKGGRIYRQTDALVMEPQVYPDAPNQQGFPSARLDPGKTYTNSFIYRFSTEK